MADIVVTIPKLEYENFAQELEDMKRDPELQKFWTLPRIPKNLNAGDRMYLVHSGRVAYSVRVNIIEEDSETQCETTGRTWGGGCQVFGNDLREEKGPDVRGFQGFRYRWW
jgi:hypothetical protein